MHRRLQRQFRAELLLASLSFLALGACDGSDDSSAAARAAGSQAPAPAAATPAPGPTTEVGTATLTWTPPATNTDGTPLTNLAGYTIVYGTSSSDLDQTVELDDPTLTTYTIDDLAAGTWYFAVNSVNTDGTASTLSPVASKVIAD
jgi:hypothetical protein